ETMISVWPRFVPDDQFYDTLRKNNWFIHLADGTPIDGLPYDRAGSDIDTTNPEAAQWYWNTIRDNIISKGFDSLWPMKPSPICLPKAPTIILVPARSSSTSIRSSTPRRSTTASARTSRTGAR